MSPSDGLGALWLLSLFVLALGVGLFWITRNWK